MTEGSVQFFEIDVLSGDLFFKGIDRLESSSLSVQISVRDKQEAADFLDITVQNAYFIGAYQFSNLPNYLIISL